MHSTQGIAALLKKYLENRITKDELILLENWRKQDSKNEKFFYEITENDQIYEDTLTWLELQQHQDEHWLETIKAKTLTKITNAKKAKRIQQRVFITYASAAILLITMTITFLQRTPDGLDQQVVDLTQIVGGDQNATLTLSNGKNIDLRADKDGIIMGQNLSYKDGTEILNIGNEKLERLTATINVPKGGKYHVVLPDGSKVWLNSMSTLTYPLAFTKDTRVVTIKGEAYFEIAKITNAGKRVPFRVHCEHQTIEVKGTAFNVKAYPEDQEIITTLVEGIVDLHAGNETLRLAPNQQATNKGPGSKLSIKKVDINNYIAWKDNKFLFFETPLPEVMGTLSRWYDLQINYQGEYKNTFLYGEISRGKSLSEVLDLLQKSGIKFTAKRQNKKIVLTVMY
ncbi:FecR family protein [Sphingobacterium shayense]|uniref:FecR family protein n=1 Tax=Sphingobacterium shayense TaxID=626343 RepID=UPI001555C004|nr:FecR family protein [Sphingobacterium shayense]NQD70431.1 FecR family protein [Sphingobacterium shayense]